MVGYILQRLSGMIAVMLLVVTIVFVIVRVTPGDPAAVMLGPEATAQDVADLRTRLGLDRSIISQYVIYVGQLLRGDLGQSIFLNMPVTSALMERAEPTFFLTLLSLAIASTIALPVGIYAAYRRGSFLDQAATTLAMLGASIPGFWLGLILMQVFAVRLGILPVSGYGGPDTGLLERIKHLILPAVALGSVYIGLLARITRATMLEVLAQDYVRTARAKGAEERKILFKHALKNCSVPIITTIGSGVALLIGGAIVTETVFAIPGLGRLTVDAILRRDYPVIQGVILLFSFMYVLVNLLVDMLYTVFDPRIRY